MERKGGVIGKGVGVGSGGPAAVGGVDGDAGFGGAVGVVEEEGAAQGVDGGEQIGVLGTGGVLEGPGTDDLRAGGGGLADAGEGEGE